MKKIISVIPALMLCGTLSVAAAETVPAATSEPVEEPPRIEESASQFVDSLRGTWNAFLGLAGDAGDIALTWTQGALDDAQAFIGDRLVDLQEWFDETGRFFAEKSGEIGESVSRAWETLKEGAAQAGKYTREELDSAYQTVRAWFETSGDTVEENVLEAVDRIAEAAGVQVGTLTDWIDTVNACIEEKKDTVTEEVVKAWETMKAAAEEGGEQAKAGLEEAYQTVREWVLSAVQTEEDDVCAAVDNVATAAGLEIEESDED